MPTVTLELEVITAALKEQLGRNADSATLVKTVASLSRYIARRASNAKVRVAADGLKVRMEKLSRASHVPRFVIQDMLEEFIRQIESQLHRPSV